MATAVLAALAGLIAVTLLAARRAATPALAPLRALFPSWRFFARAAGSPRLFVRSAAPGATLGAWLPIDGTPRSATSALFAPAGNLALAYHAVVDRLVGELDEATHDGDHAVADSVSYELVTHIACAHAPAALRGVAGAQLQWKIVVPGDGESIAAVTSPVLAP